LQQAAILRRLQRYGRPWYELYHDIFAKSIGAWNQAFKLRQLRLKTYRSVAAVLLLGAVAGASYDSFRNHHDRYLQLGSETVSDRVEVYQGAPDSWDLLRQRRFLYESDFARGDIEADKRFQRQALADLNQTEAVQIGQLPLQRRMLAYAEAGLFDKAEAVFNALYNPQDEASLKVFLTQQTRVRTLASFEEIKKIYDAHPRLQSSMFYSLWFLTPRAERSATLKDDINDKRSPVAWDAKALYYRRLFEMPLPKLLALLEDQDIDVRLMAAKALTVLNAQAAIPKLLTWLEGAGDAQRVSEKGQSRTFMSWEMSNLRRAAAEHLGRLNAQIAIPKLITLLDGKDTDVCKAAVEALGQLNAQAAIPQLILSLDDNHCVYTLQVLDVLGRLKAQAAIPKAIALLDSENIYLPQKALAFLDLLKAQAAIPKLLALLDGKDLDMVQAAAIALGNMGAHEAIPKLSAIWDKRKEYGQSNISLPLAAAKALGQLSMQTFLPSLFDELATNSRAYYVDSALQHALEQPTAHTAIPTLIALLDDRHEEIRLKATRALSQLNAQAAIPKLIALSNDEESSVREAASKALSQLKATTAIPKLIDLLDSQRDYEQTLAARALADAYSDPI
jgi:HEAT repeat protein